MKKRKLPHASALYGFFFATGYLIGMYLDPPTWVTIWMQLLFITWIPYFIYLLIRLWIDNEDKKEEKKSD
jgi:hypothetical protein